MDYNQTLNLPKTDFPMRAGLPKREPEFLARWEANDQYKKLMDHNDGKPLFVLHDGPPYANGDIHIGHALNKTLKDFIVRYKNMTGFKSPYVPGWDTHGLPTELAASVPKLIFRTLNFARFAVILHLVLLIFKENLLSVLVLSVNGIILILPLKRNLKRNKSRCLQQWQTRAIFTRD